MLDFFFFFFNDTATTEIYTLSLHDALPILDPAGRYDVHPHALRPDLLGEGLAVGRQRRLRRGIGGGGVMQRQAALDRGDRKSTRLNSSHANISYAVFCLKKKKKKKSQLLTT